MRRRTFLWSLPIAAAATAEPMKDPLFRFGVIADCQFADQPDSEPLTGGTASPRTNCAKPSPT